MNLSLRQRHVVHIFQQGLGPVTLRQHAEGTHVVAAIAFGSNLHSFAQTRDS